MDIIDKLLHSIPIPELARVEQKFDRPVVADIEKDFSSKLHHSGVLKEISKGWQVAITVGSRSISNGPLIVKLLVKELKKRGADPFIIPAMGSHGGASALGQRNMLESMGFTESYVQAPIRSSMEVVQLGKTSKSLPVYIDRYAHKADAIIIFNRIKPHVSFRGNFESGLLKMIAIGLGKQKGAEACHELGFEPMEQNIIDIARISLNRSRISFAVALIENGYHETCSIEILKKEEIEQKEPALQQRAKDLLPRIFFKELDVLIIDEIGKDISGTGFDTNVVGYFHTPCAYAIGSPDIARIAVLDLTEASHGNANGLGILDFTTRRLFNKLRFDQTYPNALTSTVPLSAKIPMVLKNDRLAIQAAIKTCNIADKKEVRMVRIKNTIKVDQIEVSGNLLEEVRNHEKQRILSDPCPLDFDEHGNLF